MTDSCFPTFGLSHEGGDRKGAREQFTCASQLFLRDLYSSVNEHHAVIKNMSKSIEMLGIQFFYFLNLNVGNLKHYSFSGHYC